MRWRNLWQRILRIKGAVTEQADDPSIAESTLRRVKPNGQQRRMHVLQLGAERQTTKMIPQITLTSRAHWVFEVVSGADRGRQFVGMTNEIKIGRQFDNHIQLNDPKISRLHAVIFRKGADLYVRDMNSTNGTWINQVRVIKPVKIEAGDEIRVGATIIAARFEKE